MKKLRKRVFGMIELSSGDDKLSTAYDVTMLLAILVSMIPLCFKESNRIFSTLELITTLLFVLDYLLRLFTADLKLGRGAISFVLYPFTFMAIIDLLAILPGFNLLAPGLRLLKLYKELGGEILTIGSDAHRAADVGADWGEAADIAVQAGFRYLASFENRKPVFHKLDT